MPRKTKNIIMILVIIIMLCSIGLTGYFANKNSNTTQKIQINSSSNNQKIPTEIPQEKPNEDNSKNNNTNKPPMHNDFERKNVTNKTSIDWYYYLLFGIESLIIVLILVYLIMSKFNKKTYKETFINTDKKIIYILLVIILTTVLTSGTITTVSKIFNSNNQIETKEILNQRQIPNNNQHNYSNTKDTNTSDN